MAKMKESQELAELPHTEVVGGQAPPSFLTKIPDAGGRGTSQKAEDNTVPILRILQDLSPVVKRNDVAYIEGAEPGMIWMKNSPTPLVNGDEGIVFQPAHFWHGWITWRPRSAGGGLTGRFDERPQEARKQIDPKTKKESWVMPNGDDCIESRSQAGFVVQANGAALPYVIGFSSSGHTTHKNWMALMNSFTDQGKPLDAWVCLYKLRAKARRNNLGTWYDWDISHAGYITTEAEYQRGLALYNAFASGEKVAETEGAAQDQQEIPF